MRSTFSIIIPIHGKRDGRTPITSVLIQKYPKDLVEILVVEDDNAKCFLPELVISHHDQRLERNISRNEGMERAKNDWIIWLDSDDEFISTALYNLDYYIRKFPEFKIFHWGGVVYWEPKTWDEENYEPRTTIRPTPEIPENPGGDVGMGFFPTGMIASGHFCFRRELLEELGGLPHTTSPYELAKMAAKEFPEFQTMMDNRGVDTLGNPHGDDYYFFYKLTRKHKSKALPLKLYLQHVRR